MGIQVKKTMTGTGLRIHAFADVRMVSTTVTVCPPFHEEKTVIDAAVAGQERELRQVIHNMAGGPEVLAKWDSEK